jgi:preprotein translocase subunit YajC
MSFFIQPAYAAAQPQNSGADAVIQFAFLGGLFVLFYVIAIRPQRKRQKEHAAMVAALAKGDEVVTTSGMLGKVIKLEENFVVLKVTDNVELKFQRNAVHAVLPKGTIKSV